MRYRDFKLMEFAQPDQADAEPRVSIAQQSQQPQKSALPTAPQTRSASEQKIIDRFISRCIPRDIEPREAQEALAYLRKQITSIEQVRQLDNDDIMLSLRQHYAGETNKLGSNLGKLLASSGVGDRDGMGDSDAIAKLLAMSLERVRDEIVVTVASTIDNGSIVLDQDKFNILKLLGGRPSNATRANNFIKQRFKVERGIYLHFRDIRDPVDVGFAVLIDTDRHLIYLGKKYNKFRIVTTDTYTVNADKIRKIVFAGGEPDDHERKTMTEVLIDRLTRYQAMMNDDDIRGLYQALEVRIEKTEQAAVDAGDDNHQQKRLYF